MIPELGLYLLITATIATVLSLGAGALRQELVQVRALRLSSALVFGAFVLLAYSFYQVDLSVQIVYQHADHALPALYRIGAVWGGHEGSILLWVTILNAWIVAGSFVALPESMRRYNLSILSFINLGFLLFILTVSNPFARYLPISPTSGQDLNPFLQDPVMLIHPPILYMGYLGFILPFALAIAVLIKGEFAEQALRVMRSSTLVAWSFLTLGIALGSFWAYYELGWGGWWFWDPVENASLMPWIAGCALLHILRVVQTRQSFQAWALLLCLLAFALSVLGTFLVRSGALTSVHSFANDPKRGLFILCLLAIYLIPALILYSLRAGRLQHPIQFTLTSREGLILINNVILMIILATVLLGTLYPLAIESLGLGFISVGAPYFNALVIPMGLVLGGLIVFTWYALRIGVRRQTLGMHLAHAGFLVLILGIALSSHYSLEEDVILSPGQSHQIGDYDFTLDKILTVQGPNYQGIQAILSVSDQGKFIGLMSPEKRFYNQGKMPIAEIALNSNLSRDLYLALAEPLNADRWILRIQVKAWIRLIWGGALMMALGGFLAMTKRGMK